MRYLKIPENTAYNPMIYIPFFIVILIDKRGGFNSQPPEGGWLSVILAVFR